MGTLTRGVIVIAIAATLVFCHAAHQDGSSPVLAPTPKAAVLPDAAPPPLNVFADASVSTIPDDEPTRWAPIDAVVRAGIEASKMPGCVVVVGRHDEILFERAYGSRALLPAVAPMTVDTVFDLASLTKPTATATSIMILVERGKIDIDARASKYIPELAKLPPFTLKNLLTHTSGLPAITPMADYTTDRAEVMKRIGALTLKAQPGEKFNYSDVGFVVLQEIVERMSGKSLAQFSQEEIFTPLGMKDTGFLPNADVRARAAPTEQRDGGFMQGEVHDPRAFALGGVSGNAGVFSTARDMSRYARAMLSKGILDGKRVMNDKTFDRMITKIDTPKGGRGLGWDIDSSFATHRSASLSSKAFGHGGYTGTAMWIDPEKDLFIVFLSNRVHPDGKGAVNPLVSEIATLAISGAEVKPGIDMLRAESFERLRGAHIGLITNMSARAKDGTATVDVLRGVPKEPGKADVTLTSIFTPEHGLNGDLEGVIKDTTYNGVPVYSLYGDRFTPASTSLDGVDTIVFDLQDVGMRFYTYASTMKRAMKVANEKHLKFVVLDRPNPIGGVDVQGPVLAETDVKGFVNHHALPLRHGMTMGELARLFSDDDKMNDTLRLDVVRMMGWKRKDTYDRTGLTWTSPSPNLRSVRSVALYPAIGLLESTNVTVGRGTDLPFEIVAAPWMNAEEVVKKLREANIAGVSFETIEVTPKSSVHANKKCVGFKIRVTDASHFEPIRTGLSIAAVLHEVHPGDWDFDGLSKMLRSKAALEAIRSGKSIADVEATWALDLGTFKAKREHFLLYR